ncbi:AP endonuclease [Clostridium botulinum]|nr:AP endonuclease [Clostridium botulinum]NFS52939.1 AP endonuclease [Clostridium botulinum]NFT16461.1 AP endonuclease [Clostridium botulinum]
MLINNVEIEDLDLLDADVAERYQGALEKMEKAKKIETTNLAEIIRNECGKVFDFFNEVFGEGTDKKIFGNKTNYRECENAFKELVDYANKEVKNITKKFK